MYFGAGPIGYFKGAFTGRFSMRPSLAPIIAICLMLVPSPASTAPDDPPDQVESKPLNVLLITVDTLRVDALGWIGGRTDTPAIDSLAKTGAAFATAVSPVPITLPAHTSIFTGLLPARHGIRDNGQTVPTELPLLTEELGRIGYSTAAFVSGFPLKDIFGLDRGFDHYDDTMDRGNEGWVERIATDTSTAAVEWIENVSPPWFVWVHYYDPHDPYEPPRSFLQQGSHGDYLGEVAFTDFAIERLLTGIPKPARDHMLTVFTADHGESLGEHQEKTHGFFVYDSTVVVPLIFHQPGRIKPMTSSQQPRLLDIAPTILDLIGSKGMPGIDGQSLVPILQSKPAEIPPSVIETHLPWIFFGWAPLTAMRHDNWKIIDAPTSELYDLNADPQELRNVITDHPKRAARMLSALKSMVPPQSSQATGTIDQETIESLRALGYIGAGEQPGPSAVEDLADPKDRIELRNRLQDAEAALRLGDYSTAITEFRKVLDVEPSNRFAALRIGIAYLKAGKPNQAVSRLQHSVELDPDRAETRYALADAFMKLGRFSEAAPQWRQVTRLQPRRADAWFNLGVANVKAGDRQEARTALATAIELDTTDEIRGMIAADPTLNKLMGETNE